MSRNFLSTVYRRSPWEQTERFTGYIDEQNFFADPEAFHALIEVLRPSTIVEVGSWKGHSANFMADKLRSFGISGKIICVDTFLGSQEHWSDVGYLKELHLEHGRPTIFERFMGNTIARANQDLILPLPLPASTAAVVMSNFGFKADLIYIDAGHEYADVMADLTSYWPLLSGNGVLFGDDYFHAPLRQAVQDFASSHGLEIASYNNRKWIFVTDQLRTKLAGLLPLGP
jgi:hypothetical protein